MMKGLRQSRLAWRLFAIVMVLTAVLGRTAWGQIPGLPAAAGTAKGSPATKGASPAADEKTKAAVATSAGPITVHRQVRDPDIQRFLAKFLPKYPGVRQITVAVDDGVVTLEGRVDDDSTQDEITDVVKRGGRRPAGPEPDEHRRGGDDRIGVRGAGARQLLATTSRASGS